MDTPISLPPDLIIKIECEASARGMSLADFVRISLERALAENPDDDPLFADAAIYGEGGAADFAANHDEYLYGDAS